MKYDTTVNQETVDTVVTALQAKDMDVHTADTKEEALETIKQIIPHGASVMNGSSKSLEEIGYIDYLAKNTHGWIDLHQSVTKESDPVKRAVLRKQAVTSDFYLGSVHALTEAGEFIIASNSGSQLPHIAFTSPNLIFVVGTQKIVPTMAEAMKRLEEYVLPLENEHMKQLHGVGTQLNKILMFKGENPALKRHIRFILVKEPVGF